MTEVPYTDLTRIRQAILRAKRAGAHPAYHVALTPRELDALEREIESDLERQRQRTQIALDWGLEES